MLRTNYRSALLRFAWPACLSLAVCSGCDDKGKRDGVPAAVDAGPKIETFTGMGLTFKYPQPYVVETATSNPEIHQIALDHGKEPGVLTIRFNPKDRAEVLVLDDVAEATRQRMGPEASVAPSKLEVAGKTYDARTVKANQLGLVPTIDVMAIVPIGGTNYVVLTHVSESDQKRAQTMFDTVLGSLAKAQ